MNNDERNLENIPDLRPTSTGLGRTAGLGDSEGQRKREAAHKELEEIQAIEDPIKRIKKLAIFFRRGAGREIMYDLDMTTLLDAARARAFREIKAAAASDDDPYEYLKKIVEFEIRSGITDDYSYGYVGLITSLRWNLEELMEAYSESTEQDASAEEEPQPAADSKSKSTPDRWRHLARAVLILERHPDLKTFDEFNEKAAGMQSELNVRSPDGTLSEDPGEAIKKGVLRLRQHITGEEGTPTRYHRMGGFRDLVSDLHCDRNVSIVAASTE